MPLKDQTDPTWMSPPDQRGFGFFLVPDVTSPKPRAVRKELVEDISYSECVQRGELCIAFKWVPPWIESVSLLSATQCGHPCIDTCVEPGCVCFDGHCW